MSRVSVWDRAAHSRTKAVEKFNIGLHNSHKICGDGYDVSLFPSPPPSKLICNLCQLVVRFPVAAACQHVFCHCCLLSLTEKLDKPVCPVDHAPLDLQQCSLAKELAQELHALPVICPNTGCGKELPLQDLETHKKAQCSALIRCNVCNQTIASEQMEWHNEDMLARHMYLIVQQNMALKAQVERCRRDINTLSVTSHHVARLTQENKSLTKTVMSLRARITALEHGQPAKPPDSTDDDSAGTLPTADTEYNILLLEEKREKDSEEKALLLFPNSQILTGDLAKALTTLHGGGTEWQLVYQASRDGFSAKSFHKHADPCGSSVVILKSHVGHVFGGFVSVSWGGKNTWKADEKAYLFSLVNSMGLSPLKLPVVARRSNKAVCCDPNSGPIFGIYGELWIHGTMQGRKLCRSNRLGHTFLAKDTGEHILNNNFLAGAGRFDVAEMEVWAPVAGS